jgi:hypothetical protein
MSNKLTLQQIEDGIITLRNAKTYIGAISQDPDNDYWHAWNETCAVSVDVLLKRSIELRNRLIHEQVREQQAATVPSNAT